MYIPNKYNYIHINRENINGERRYATPDGEKLPSVTTVLSATAPKEKLEALQAWRNRVGPKKAQEITTEAAGRGTRMHKWLEDFVKTGQIGEPGSNPYSIQSHRMAEIVIYEGLSNCTEFWGTEVPLYFPKIYAGTTDLVGVHDSSEAIMDHKQTNRPKKREWVEDYFLQLAAYANAHNEVHGTNIRKGVVLMCVKPDVDEQFNIIKPPEYQEFVLEGTEYDKYRGMWWDRVEQSYLSI